MSLGSSSIGATALASFPTRAPAGAPPGGGHTILGKDINQNGTGNPPLTLPTWAPGKTGKIVAATFLRANTPTCTTPSGYTYKTDFVANSSVRVYLFEKDIADADSGSSLVMAWSASREATAAVFVVEGVAWDNFIPYSATSGTGLTLPALTALSAPGLALDFFGGRSGAVGEQPVVTAFPAGTTENDQRVTTSGSQRNSLMGIAAFDYPATSIAAQSATVDLSLNTRCGIVVSLADVAGGTAGNPNRRASGAWDKTAAAQAKAAGSFAPTMIRAKVAGTFTGV